MIIIACLIVSTFIASLAAPLKGSILSDRIHRAWYAVEDRGLQDRLEALRRFVDGEKAVLGAYALAAAASLGLAARGLGPDAIGLVASSSGLLVGVLCVARQRARFRRMRAVVRSFERDTGRDITRDATLVVATAIGPRPRFNA